MTTDAAALPPEPAPPRDWRAMLRDAGPWLEMALIVLVPLLLICLPWKSGAKTARHIATIGIPAIVLALIVAGRFSIEATRPFWKPLACVFAAILASSIFSIAPLYSFEAIFEEILPNMALFLAVLVWASGDESRRRLALRAVAVGALIACAMTIYYYANDKHVFDSSDSGDATYKRAEGTLKSYSRMAMYCVLCAPCCAGLIVLGWSKKRWWEVALGLVALVAVLVALGLTQTRGAWLACAAALFVLLVQVRAIVAIAFVVIAALGAAATPGIRTRASSFVRDAKDPNLLLSGRLTIWKTGVRAIRENPILGIGYGPNIFRQPKVQESYKLETYQVQSDLHCTYLQQAAETGFLGIAAYAFLLFAVASQIMRGSPWQRGVKLSEMDEARLVTLAAALALVGLLIYAIVHNPNEERAATLFWMIAGIATSGKKT